MADIRIPQTVRVPIFRYFPRWRDRQSGFGYAKAYPVERLYSEVAVTRIALVTKQLILSCVTENALDLPNSYRPLRNSRAMNQAWLSSQQPQIAMGI